MQTQSKSFTNVEKLEMLASHSLQIPCSGIQIVSLSDNKEQLLQPSALFVARNIYNISPDEKLLIFTFKGGFECIVPNTKTHQDILKNVHYRKDKDLEVPEHTDTKLVDNGLNHFWKSLGSTKKWFTHLRCEKSPKVLGFHPATDNLRLRIL